MKNILLLGNGFDLYYKLPTKYADFLHVVDFLQKHRKDSFETIGAVFSQQTLQAADPFIKVCYDTHTKTYDSTLLKQDDIAEIIRLTEKNIWFGYLSSVFNKDVGWIDFEKEIGAVLDCFGKALKKPTVFAFSAKEQYEKFILGLFKFFIDKAPSGKVVTIGAYEVNKDYCIENPQGSKIEVINTEKVVDKLYEELCCLSKALKLYLTCFVENAYDLLKKDGTWTRIDFFSHIERVVTFNYTNTYENLYFKNAAFHIHGNTKNEIVLGVNPDQSDNIDSIDTTFVCFKKYYQRTLFDTDVDYLRYIKELIDTKMPYRVFTMGHSLDITDRDIIEELFQNASEIVILYHNFDAKKSYIANLIKIFGKDGFDMLKKDKKLSFVSLNDDLESIKAALSQEAQKDLEIMLCGEIGEPITVV